MAAPTFPRSDHCDGCRFFNPGINVNHGLADLLRWRFTSRREAWPAWVDLPRVWPLPERPQTRLAATWINHSTFLLQTPVANILIDPVYSNRAGPLSRFGPRRVHAPGVAFEALPKIDVVLVSHDHYDHCDIPTLARLAREHEPVGITPLGNGPLLRAAGFTRIVELDWWGLHEPRAGLTVTVTPARHWSNRVRGPRNGRLWGGFHLRWADGCAYHAGDTGMDVNFFHAIREKLGAPDLAMLPIGGYEPRWFMAQAHCNPAEAVQMHLDLGSRQSVGMHWGCFRLTDEAREAPVAALGRALAAAHVPPSDFRTLAPGESVILNTELR